MSGEQWCLYKLRACTSMPAAVSYFCAVYKEYRPVHYARIALLTINAQSIVAIESCSPVVATNNNDNNINSNDRQKFILNAIKLDSASPSVHTFLGVDGQFHARLFIVC